jgi:hypothetical protein
MAEQLIPFVNGVQYTGSNGTAILAEIPAQAVSDYGISIASESGGTLVMEYYPDGGLSSLIVETGDWVTWTSAYPGKLTDDQMNAAYVKRSDLP